MSCASNRPINVRKISGRKLPRITTDRQYNEVVTKQISHHDIQNLEELFHLVNLTFVQTGESLYTWVDDELMFTSNYVRQLRRYLALYDEEVDRPPAELSTNHCKGALRIYEKLAANLNSPRVMDSILKEVAASHVFLKKPSVSIKVLFLIRHMS